MSLQAEIKAYRDQHEDGYVVIYNGAVAGWKRDLSDASGWAPGCIAIGPDADEWQATGGDHYNGATTWEPAQTIQPERMIDGIPINPDLPEGFGYTPNDERPESHRIWWHQPYIETDDWNPESWEQYCARLASIGFEPDYTREEWNERQAKGRAGWFEAWPTGTRYAVYCLDGGAWDRPTGWGMFGTLEEALKTAKSGA